MMKFLETDDANVLATAAAALTASFPATYSAAAAAASASLLVITASYVK